MLSSQDLGIGSEAAQILFDTCQCGHCGNGRKFGDAIGTWNRVLWNSEASDSNPDQHSPTSNRVSHAQSVRICRMVGTSSLS